MPALCQQHAVVDCTMDYVLDYTLIRVYNADSMGYVQLNEIQKFSSFVRCTQEEISFQDCGVQISSSAHSFFWD